MVDLLLHGQDDAVFGGDAEAGAALVDGGHGVLYLVEAAFGGEGGGAAVVSSGHGLVFCFWFSVFSEVLRDLKILVEVKDVILTTRGTFFWAGRTVTF